MTIFLKCACLYDEILSDKTLNSNQKIGKVPDSRLMK